MFKQHLAKFIRTVTVPPVMALMLLIILYITKNEFFGTTLNLVLAIVFLVVLPILAYPLQPLIPGFKGKGREGQRNLALLMASLGYICGLMTALFLPVSKYLLIIYLTYLFSGISLVLLNKVFKVRASGHACGVAGPIFSLIIFLGPWVLFGILLLAAVYWASLRMDRHDKSELLIGTTVPTYALMLAFLIVLGYTSVG
ncbi:MAG: hypothetical protein GXY05_01440 [Clostridiales bacterium]|nr:hypothetical protein [Clostridiales bacterium]